MRMRGEKATRKENARINEGMERKDMHEKDNKEKKNTINGQVDAQ